MNQLTYGSLIAQNYERFDKSFVLPLVFTQADLDAAKKKLVESYSQPMDDSPVITIDSVGAWEPRFHDSRREFFLQCGRRAMERVKSRRRR